MWMTGTYDPELNLVYVGTGNPTPVLNGRSRPGDNPWTCSIVALNPDTGKLAWGFQASPHDTHDWDAAGGAGPRRWDLQRHAAQAADAGVAQRILLRARSHQRQEPADDAVRRRELGEGHRQGRPSDSRSGQGAVARRRPGRAERERRDQLSIAELRRRRPACSSSARRMRTASTSSSRSTARTGGRVRTTTSGARACCARSTIRPARSAGATISATGRPAPAC